MGVTVSLLVEVVVGVEVEVAAQPFHKVYVAAAEGDRNVPIVGAESHFQAEIGAQPSVGSRVDYGEAEQVVRVDVGAVARLASARQRARARNARRPLA